MRIKTRRLFDFSALLAAIVMMAAGASWAAPIDTPAGNAFMVDYATGAVLLDKNADEPMPPASMSKLMTVYMVFERLRNGGLSLDDTFQVSEKAWRMGGSKMFVLVDTRVSVEDLLRGIIVQSGNDACIVVAEAMGGSEAGFADQMNERAAELGMTTSHFTNATGWPDPGHYMSARDLAFLARRIISEFPEYYTYFAETNFAYNDISQPNRNPLLFRNVGADGLKTGHTEESGYGLVSSAVRNDRRIILVVNGLGSTKERDRESQRLLDWGFREFNNYALFTSGEVVKDAEVWLGQAGTVPLILPRDIELTLRRQARRKLEVKYSYTGPIPAPVRAGQELATLQISAPDFGTMTVPLLAGRSVERLGFFGRLGAIFNHLLWGTSER